MGKPRIPRPAKAQPLSAHKDRVLVGDRALHRACGALKKGSPGIVHRRPAIIQGRHATIQGRHATIQGRHAIIQGRHAIIQGSHVNGYCAKNEQEGP